MWQASEAFNIYKSDHVSDWFGFFKFKKPNFKIMIDTMVLIIVNSKLRYYVCKYIKTLKLLSKYQMKPYLWINLITIVPREQYINLFISFCQFRFESVSYIPVSNRFIYVLLFWTVIKPHFQNTKLNY